MVVGSWLVVACGLGVQVAGESARAPDGIDATTLLQWREACQLVERHESEIWPGYRLAEIPALIANPNVAEVLIRHPLPPPGFARWAGESPLGDEPLFARKGATTFSSGMDTSTSVGGITTLVVTDRGARGDSDDAWNLAVMVHEGFHAWADKHFVPGGGSELDLLEWPDLDPAVNAHLELEGRALVAALNAPADATDEFEEQALLFLAERERRRARMPAPAIAYEDRNELNEGLASYVEWRAYDLWARDGLGEPLRAALPKLRVPAAFQDRSAQMVNMLNHSSRGTLAINGSSFGPGAVRRRGYFSGAAIGRLLDRLESAGDEGGSTWKAQSQKGRALTTLLREALGDPADAELAERAAAFEKDAGFDALLQAKEKLVAQGRAERDRRIAAVLEGEGTLLVLDLSAIAPKGPLAPSSFTPFGVLKVDDHRRLFSQSPTSFAFGVVRLETSIETPVIVDEQKRELLFRTPIAAEAVRAAFEAWNGRYADSAVTIEAPGAAVTTSDAESARVTLRAAR